MSDDVQSNMEFRVMQLERQSRDLEQRLRNVELTQSALGELKDDVRATRKAQEQLSRDQARNVYGFLLVILSVVGGVVLHALGH